MSTTPNPIPSPVLAPSKPVVAEDVTLRSGNLLSVADTDELARSVSTTLTIMVGPPDAGKSTLLATIHEGFRSGKFASLSFAGSRTLVAFEQVCHLSRIASGLEHPDTQRTKFSEEELYYHFAANRVGVLESVRSLFVMDVAGEGFDDLRKSHENCLNITSLKRTEFLTLLVDGDKLGKPRERFAAIEDTVNFLKCVWDSGAVKRDCQLQVVISKVDKLQDAPGKQAVAEVQEAIVRRLDHRFSNRSFHEIAARPKAGCAVVSGHGVESLLVTWIAAKEMPVGSSVPLPVLEERESEAFLHRYVKNNSA